MVTTECSAPVSTMKVIGQPPTSIVTMGSQGPRLRERGRPYSEFMPTSPIRSWVSGSIWNPLEVSCLGRGPLFRCGHSFFQCPVSLQYTHWFSLSVPFLRGPLSGFVPIPGVDTGVPSAATRSTALCFIFFSLSLSGQCALGFSTPFGLLPSVE